MFKRAWRSIRNNILVGLILIIPLVITGLVVNWLFTFITNQVIKFVPKDLIAARPEILFRVVGLVAVLVILFFIGLLVRNFIGRRLYRFGDTLLGRIPIVNKIYMAVRQMSEAFLDQSQTLFKEVVLVEYPRKGIYSMGFVTSNVPANMVPPNGAKDLVAVFVPTSPNPTSGWFTFTSRSELFALNISVADAMKLVVSGGAVFPGTAIGDNRPTLLDKLEQWMAKQSKTEPPK